MSILDNAGHNPAEQPPAPIKRAENSHIWQREEYEHYVEPEWCSQRLFEVENFHPVGRTGSIWDPCCGFGRIPENAHKAGYATFSSDIVDRGYSNCGPIKSFFDLRIGGHAIVCNPPFDIFKEFALHALSQDGPGKVAMIWLVRTLPAARWLRDMPLARIHLLTPRPSMPPGHVIADGEKPGGGKQDFCWLVWDKQHTGPASIGWLHRDQR